MTPRYPVPVVRAIIPDREGRILLLRRAAGTHSGSGWCLPGGKIDYGNLVEEALRRELAEETGLDVEQSRFLFYQDSPPLDPNGMHCINFYFECRCVGKPRLNDESSEFVWADRRGMAGMNLVFGADKALERYWG
jgi:ADP-ribose pyrophosphatase YjhB (NUDIX family)